MKKVYEKPVLLCEKLLPEELLAGCSARGGSYNEVTMCGYTLPNTSHIAGGIVIFADTWTQCNQKDDGSYYCYQAGPAAIFGS